VPFCILVIKILEWLDYFCIILDVVSTPPGHAEEAFQLLHIFGSWEFSNLSDSFIRQVRAISGNNLAKVGDFTLCKLAFLWIQRCTSGSEAFEYLAKDINMRLSLLGPNAHIVDICRCFMPLKVTHDVIHCTLECGTRVLRPERHSHEFEVTEWADECCLGYVFGFHGYLPVPCGQIERTAKVGVGIACREVLHFWQRVCISFRFSIETRVVDAQAPGRAAIFAHHDNWASPR